MNIPFPSSSSSTRLDRLAALWNAGQTTPDEEQELRRLLAADADARYYDVRAALALYSPDIDMVVTVKEAASNPYYNCYETDNDGFLHISKGDGGYTRRQDAPKVWEYNGAVYVINVESLRRMPLSAFTRRRMSVMPAERSVDLDTPVDWLIAEKLIENSKQ